MKSHPIQVRTVEIRDEGTTIPALAIYVWGSRVLARDSAPYWLVSRAGWGPTPAVMLIKLHNGEGMSDPFDWPNRTMHYAHLHLRELLQGHNELWPDGDVLDVQFILGETRAKKRSERLSELGEDETDPPPPSELSGDTSEPFPAEPSEADEEQERADRTRDYDDGDYTPPTFGNPTPPNPYV